MFADLYALDGEVLALPDEEAFRADRAHRSFHEFIRYAWPQIEPGAPFIDSWEVGAMAEHCQAVTEGQIQDLWVNIRPRATKSAIFGKLWPAWDWLQDPAREWLTTSFDLALAREASGGTRRLIESEWFRERWGAELRILRDKRAEGWYRTTAGGARRIASPRAGTTGRGGNRLLLDDPHDTKRVESPKEREATTTWVRRTFLNRRNNPMKDSRVVIGQRTHPKDAFSILEELGWKDRLIIPTRFDTKRRVFTSIGWTDPRTKDGELANPARHGEKEDALARLELEAIGYAAQHDQKPTPEGGTMFRQKDWRRWRLASDVIASGFERPANDSNGHEVRIIPDPGPDGQGWADYFDEVVQSWDFTFKGEGKDIDNVAGHVWGRKGGDAFLLASTVKRMDIVESMAAIRTTTLLFPYAYAKLVEGKANGPAIIQILRSTMLGLVEVDPGPNGKPARARAVSPFQRAGNVFIPEDVQAHPWVPLFIQRCADFPKCDKDDEIDAMSQALLHFHAAMVLVLQAEAVAGVGLLPSG